MQLLGSLLRGRRPCCNIRCTTDPKSASTSPSTTRPRARERDAPFSVTKKNGNFVTSPGFEPESVRGTRGVASGWWATRRDVSSIVVVHFVVQASHKFASFFANLSDFALSFSLSRLFLAAISSFGLKSRQHANAISMIAAAGADTLANTSFDSWTLRAENVPAGQSRATLGGSLPSWHALGVALARERSRDRERHSRRRPILSQRLDGVGAAASLREKPVHLFALICRRELCQPIPISRRRDFRRNSATFRRRRRRRDDAGVGGGAVGASSSLPRRRRRRRRRRGAATPARRRARRPFASRRRSRRARSRHAPLARARCVASRRRVSFRVPRARIASRSHASRHTPPRCVRWRRVACGGDASRRGATRCVRTRTRGKAPRRRRSSLGARANSNSNRATAARATNRARTSATRRCDDDANVR